MDYIKDNMDAELRHWEMMYEKMSEELATLPKGTVFLKKQGKNSYYYHQHSEVVEGQVKRLFSPAGVKNPQMLSDLYRKKILMKEMPIVLKNINSMRKFTDSFKLYSRGEIVRDLEEEYAPFFKGHGIILPNHLRQEYNANLAAVQEWMELPCDNEMFYPENLRHITSGGTWVRSKSELLIANILEERGIAYKYEFPITIDGIQYRPDISIVLPDMYRKVYWEHFGMVGNDSYAKKVSNKLEVYRMNGITLWDNLIITFDNAEGCLDSRTIKGLVDLFIMPHFNG